MYEFLIVVHSLFRWFVLILMLSVIVTSILGLSGDKEYTTSHKKMTIFAIGFLHIQLLTGLLLYFGYSSLGVSLFDGGMASVMGDSVARFWAVEHIFAMIVGVVVAQVGSILAKKASDDRTKFSRLAVFFSIALLLILARIPWDRI